MPRPLTNCLRRWLSQLPGWLPSCCALCGASGRDTLCSGCQQQFFERRKRRCLQCAVILPVSTGLERCVQCLRSSPAFDATVVATDYAPPVDQLVLALKFHNRLALAPLFASLLHQAVRQAPPPEMPALLTAVPLGRQRLAQRGFNQALEIARPLARLLNIALIPSLALRQRETEPQTMLPPAGRHANMRQAFLVLPHMADRLRDVHIGVVDDVMTTGETLNELAATLKRFGAARVTNLVFARTLQH